MIVDDDDRTRWARWASEDLRPNPPFWELCMRPVIVPAPSAAEVAVMAVVARVAEIEPTSFTVVSPSHSPSRVHRRRRRSPFVVVVVVRRSSSSSPIFPPLAGHNSK